MCLSRFFFFLNLLETNLNGSKSLDLVPGLEQTAVRPFGSPTTRGQQRRDEHKRNKLTQVKLVQIKTADGLTSTRDVEDLRRRHPSQL